MKGQLNLLASAGLDFLVLVELSQGPEAQLADPALRVHTLCQHTLNSKFK